MKDITEKAIEDHIKVMEEGSKSIVKLNTEMDDDIYEFTQFLNRMGVEGDTAQISGVSEYG